MSAPQTVVVDSGIGMADNQIESSPAKAFMMSSVPQFLTDQQDVLLQAGKSLYDRYTTLLSQWVGLKMLDPGSHDQLISASNHIIPSLDKELNESAHQTVQVLRHVGSGRFAAGRDDYRLSQLGDIEGQKLMKAKINALDAMCHPADTGQAMQSCIQHLKGVRRQFSQRRFWRNVLFDCQTYRPMLMSGDERLARQWIKHEYHGDTQYDTPSQCQEKLRFLVQAALSTKTIDCTNKKITMPTDPDGQQTKQPCPMHQLNFYTK